MVVNHFPYMLDPNVYSMMKFIPILMLHHGPVKEEKIRLKGVFTP